MWSSNCPLISWWRKWQKRGIHWIHTVSCLRMSTSLVSGLSLMVLELVFFLLPFLTSHERVFSLPKLIYHGCVLQTFLPIQVEIWHKLTFVSYVSPEIQLFTETENLVWGRTTGTADTLTYLWQHALLEKKGKISLPFCAKYSQEIYQEVVVLSAAIQLLADRNNSYLDHRL